MLFNPNKAFQDQIENKPFSGFTAGLSYNFLYKGSVLFAAAAEFKQSNNISELPQMDLSEETIYSDSASNTSRTSTKNYSVWKGEYELRDYFNLKGDIIYFPDFFNNRIALAGFWRMKKYKKAVHNLGFGIYFTEDGTPGKILGGIVFEFDDISNIQDTAVNITSNLTFGIIAGYNF